MCYCIYKKGRRVAYGGYMFYIRFEMESSCEKWLYENKVLTWEYDNKKDFENWLDKITQWYDKNEELHGYKLTKIEICICRLWITIR